MTNSLLKFDPSLPAEEIAGRLYASLFLTDNLDGEDIPGVVEKEMVSALNGIPMPKRAEVAAALEPLLVETVMGDGTSVPRAEFESGLAEMKRLPAEDIADMLAEVRGIVLVFKTLSDIRGADAEPVTKSIGALDAEHSTLEQLATGIYEAVNTQQRGFDIPPLPEPPAPRVRRFRNDGPGM